MNKRNFLKYLLSTFSILNLSQLDAKNSTLIQRKIPKDQKKIPAIGLGTYIGFDIDEKTNRYKELAKLMHSFNKFGGKLVDTSPMYGNAEYIIGKLNKDFKLNNKLFFATKVWTNGQTNGQKQIQNSFNLMNIKKCQLVQIHNLLDWKSHLYTLEKLKEQGLIDYIGITHFHSGAYDDLIKIIKMRKFDFVQFNHSIVERQAEKKLIPFANDYNHGIIINRPFAGGSLFRKVKGIALPVWANEIECDSWAQFFLKYILSFNEVTCVIPGTSKHKHLIDNMKAGFGILPDVNLRKKMQKFITEI
jgi:diketogulonate reductase-like aldo/keto reductase